MSKRVRVPSVFQIEACECGAAALSMILKYYRCTVPMEQLRVECAVSRDGSTAANLVSAAKLHGLEARGYRKEATALLDVSYPCILHWNFNHFVVLEGIRGKKVYINDPESGRRKITMDELEASFTGVVLCFTPGEDFKKNIKLDSVTKLIAKRMIMDMPATLTMVMIGILLVLPGIILPAMTQMFIDHVLLRGTDFWLNKILIVIVLAYAYQLVFMWMRQTVLARVKLKLTMVTDYKLMKHMLRLPVSFFEQRYMGELSTRIENNNQVNAFLAGNLSSVLLDIIEALFYLVLMIIYSPLLSLIGVLGIAANMVMSYFIVRPIASMNLKLNQDIGHLNAKVCAGFSVSSSIKACGIENEYASEMIGSYANTTASDQKLGMASQILSSFPDMVFHIANLIIIIVGGVQIIKGECTTGTLTAFTMILSSLNGPVQHLIAMSKGIQDMRADMARVDDIESADEDPRYAAVMDEEDNGLLSGQIEVSNLTFGYNIAAPAVVNDLSLRLSPGSQIAIVGASGCGKSTVAKLIAGMMQPWSGSIRYDGKEIYSIPRELLSNHIAVIEQHPTVFTGSIKDNLTFFGQEFSEADMKKALEDADAMDMISALPYGIDHKLLEGGKNISGGQRQRLAIARALYKNPTVLIMDEATSALDALSEKKITDNIRRRGCTCIIVAHRLSAIKNCDAILVMDQGRMAEFGSHEQLMEKKGIYARLVEV